MTGWVSPQGVTQQPGADVPGYGATRLTQRKTWIGSPMPPPNRSAARQPRSAHPGAAQVQVLRLPLQYLLATPWSLGRTQGAVRELPALRPRRRRLAGRRLGRLGSPAAGHGGATTSSPTRREASASRWTIYGRGGRPRRAGVGADGAGEHDHLAAFFRRGRLGAGWDLQSTPVLA